MFDWFYEFLYSITKVILMLIDGLISCANMLCGIEEISVEGQKTDFMSYLLTSEPVMFAFKVAALLGMIVVVVFAVIAILRTIAKEKSEGTPAQVVGKVVKNILLFLFVPSIILVCFWAGNIFMEAVYNATTQGTGGLGNFLFVSFAQESNMEPAMAQKFLDGTWSYSNLSNVKAAMDISQFEFVFSWLSGGIILYAIGKGMLLFVDRVISIVILFIVSPFSIASSTLDDGARFKLWREQVLIKFITGYGMIIAINVFAMVCNLVMNPGLVFFEKGSFLDFVMKLLIIGGGAITMSKSMALIGNLVSSGAGSNELRDNAIAGGLGGLMSKIPGVGMAKAIGQAMKQEATGAIAQGVLPNWLQRSYSNKNGGGAGGKNNQNGGNGEEGSNSKNDLPNLSGSDDNNAKTSILGDGDKKDEKKDKPNENHNENKNDTGNQLLHSALNNDNNNNNDNNTKSKDYDDFYE